jgi:EAL and modified HD-GYP domain-containing signal transduction protein
VNPAHLVHVGRQPIFDRAGHVVAYELLFRGSMDAVEAGRRDTYATSHVIVNAFTEFGIGEVAAGRMCFINLTQEFLTGELKLPFGPQNVVLEVLETVVIDDEVVAGITALVAEGYHIALDDFVWGEGHERLLSLASYVKLDLLEGDLNRLEEIVVACRRHPDIQLVAERLETTEQLAIADRYGMELRQGYALSRPQVLTASSISPSRLRRLELLSALSAPDAKLDSVLSIIASDPALTLRVLRATNSAAHAAAARVSSVRQAVVLIGLPQIRQWAMLMVIDDVAEATEDQLITALTRARLSENVAAALGVAVEDAFMAGLITGVAALLNMSNASLSDQLPLSTEIADALLDGTGPVGRVLHIVDAYERGDVVPECPHLAADYIDALRWSTRAVLATSRLAAA